MTRTTDIKILNTEVLQTSPTAMRFNEQGSAPFNCWENRIAMEGDSMTLSRYDEKTLTYSIF